MTTNKERPVPVTTGVQHHHHRTATTLIGEILFYAWMGQNTQLDDCLVNRDTVLTWGMDG